MDETENPIEAVEVAEAVIAPVADAIATAQEAEAEATRTAEAIAAAAIESERGHRIDLIERELAACQNNLNNLEMTLATLPELIAGETLAALEPMNNRLSVVEAALESLRMAGALNTSIPPASEPAEPVIVTEPTETPPPEKEAESPAPVPRKKRFLSL